VIMEESKGDLMSENCTDDEVEGIHIPTDEELGDILDEYIAISSKANQRVDLLGLPVSPRPEMDIEDIVMPLNVKLVNDIELGNLRWKYTAFASYAGEQASDAESDATNVKMAYEEIRDIIMTKIDAGTITEKKALANNNPVVRKARMLMLEKKHIRDKIYSRLLSYKEKAAAMSREQARRRDALEKAKYSGDFDYDVEYD
jgi:hypothetical protein